MFQFRFPSKMANNMSKLKIDQNLMFFGFHFKSLSLMVEL